MSILKCVCVSTEKEDRAKNIHQANVVPSGISGDMHCGSGKKQVSMLPYEKVKELETINPNIIIETLKADLTKVDELKRVYQYTVDKDYFVETGEGYDSMRDVVSNSIQHIIDSSFSLPNRKSIILGEDRQVVELVYELYGNLNRLDEFIVDNKLNYNEIEVIPMGREVAYYV